MLPRSLAVKSQAADHRDGVVLDGPESLNRLEMFILMGSMVIGSEAECKFRLKLKCDFASRWNYPSGRVSGVADGGMVVMIMLVSHKAPGCWSGNVFDDQLRPFIKIKQEMAPADSLIARRAA